MVDSHGSKKRTLADEMEGIKTLLNHISVDVKTGVAVWEFPTNRRVRKGSIAGTVDGLGYTRINFMGSLYLLHRIVFYVSTGRLPCVVDHKKGTGAGNGIDNLQEATQQQNSMKKSMQSNNKTGFVGVSFHKAAGKYQASIRKDGKSHHLGLYDTPEEAYSKYCENAKIMFGEFYNGE